MKVKTALLLLCTMALLASSAIPAVAGSHPAPKKRSAPAAPTPASQTDAEKRALTADAAYKSNCLRCHGEPRKYSERAMKTILRHMRVRANMTEEEARLVLEYLTK
ncbi:MAG: hypothetical protein HYX28_04225 [Candidatus Koribacter versatilis]|uniref:Cytochrome c domain-containing protein n=1 Tax=Candidatus Korobacter versatilis TaxID=658062 RepID=A0A932EP28_9BACT|nr:hypothetical protein [Candidatus Koribacter versatilis]